MLVVVLHIVGTVLLIDASFRELRAMKEAMDSGQPEPSFLWLTVLSWIWAPVPRVIAHFITPTSPSEFFYMSLLWSLTLGVCFGFIVPRVFRWRQQFA